VSGSSWQKTKTVGPSELGGIASLLRLGEELGSGKGLFMVFGHGPPSHFLRVDFPGSRRRRSAMILHRNSGEGTGGGVACPPVLSGSRMKAGVPGAGEAHRLGIL